MVGVPGRSRGCSTCRKRKIKCDRTIPQCTQCRRSERVCSGPRTGAFFSSTIVRQEGTESRETTLASVSRQGAVPTSPDGQKQPYLSLQGEGGDGKRKDDPFPSTGLEEALEGLRRIGPSEQSLDVHSSTRDISSQFRLPSNRQPSAAIVIEQLFVSHFVESFRGQRETPRPAFWLLKLPALLATPRTPVAAKQSIRATAMMFYGITTGEVSVKYEAYRWYGAAMESLRSLIPRCTFSNDSNAKLFAEDVVCAPVMFFHFEMMARTSPEGWVQHVDAAAMILERLGPENCQVGLAHQLFLNVRLFLVFASMIAMRNRPHPFASYRWINVPFETASKNKIDRLLDILLSYPRCLYVGDNASRQSNPELNKLGSELYGVVRSLLHDLEAWWLQYILEVNSSGDQEDFYGIAPDIMSSALDISALSRVSYYDTSTATFISLYHTAIITAYSHLSHISSTLADVYEPRIKQHAEAVMVANAFLKSHLSIAPGGGSMLLMLFPLKIVGLLSPSLHQRSDAARQLRDWNQNAGFCNTPTIPDIS